MAQFKEIGRDFENHKNRNFPDFACFWAFGKAHANTPDSRTALAAAHRTGLLRGTSVRTSLEPLYNIYPFMFHLDLPGLGQLYCVHCARHFISDTDNATHCETKSFSPSSSQLVASTQALTALHLPNTPGHQPACPRVSRPELAAVQVSPAPTWVSHRRFS